MPVIWNFGTLEGNIAGQNSSHLCAYCTYWLQITYFILVKWSYICLWWAYTTSFFFSFFLFFCQSNWVSNHAEKKGTLFIYSTRNASKISRATLIFLKGEMEHGRTSGERRCMGKRELRRNNFTRIATVMSATGGKNLIYKPAKKKKKNAKQSGRSLRCDWAPVRREYRGV